MKRKLTNLKKGILFTIMCLISSTILAQSITVRGNVTDGLGESLVGVTVQVEGTSVGTVTDIDGNFTLPNVPQMLFWQYHMWEWKHKTLL